MGCGFCGMWYLVDWQIVGTSRDLFFINGTQLTM